MMSESHSPSGAKSHLVEIISQKVDWDEDISRALDIAIDVEHVDKTMPRSIDVVLRILEMGVDRNTVIATLLSDPQLKPVPDAQQIKSAFGEKVALLTQGVNQLNSIQDYKQPQFKTPEQAEKLRRLLMAIITDVRVMVIKLCYRVERLKLLKHNEGDVQRMIAQETLDIYAPLANRLGMGLIKWEMEDLAFRALDPLAYKKIATLLEEKRRDREAFIQDFSCRLQEILKEQGVKADVSGRVKHIVSIWRKMQKKNLEFHELFDVRAVRILVDTIADCYAVLGVVHTTWKHIPKEFDDYIANPKDNGYQSLHTAVASGNGQIVEVQIRTCEMHEKSEFGVASHWRYKEGVRLDQRMENSISRMREMLDGPAAQVSDFISDISAEISSERVYVFSPKGQVVDIPRGGTPLDFAYGIHSEVGHRCRGAKVNGRIVNLTTELHTGDEVEILTAKEGKPSRDWMNKNLGYIKSAGNRSKVRSWFSRQNFQNNVVDGKSIYERVLTKYSIHHAEVNELIEHFKRKDVDNFYADIGRGLITAAQIIGYFQAGLASRDPLEKIKKSGSKGPESNNGISIQGVGNLLTHFAQCCKPVPGDSVIGFITVNSGVTVHKHNCPNMLALPEQKRQRLIEVEWGNGLSAVYPVGISVSAFQRTGLMQDISTVLASEKINLLDVNSTTNKVEQMVYTKLTIEIKNVDQLVMIVDKLSQLANVQDVRRIA